MERVGVRSLIWYPGVLAASSVGALVSGMSTILLFVIVGETLFYFLSLCFTALVAALCAVLVGDVLANDGRRVRLWSVVGVSEAAGVLVALVNLAFMYAAGDVGGLPGIGLGRQMTLSAVAISLVSGLAVWGLRRPPVAEAPKDARSAALLIVLSLLLLVAGVAIDGMSGPIA